MESIHLLLTEHLDGAMPPAPDVIESLLSRLYELSVACGAAEGQTERILERFLQIC